VALRSGAGAVGGHGAGGWLPAARLVVASAALAAFGGWLGIFLPQLEIVLPVLDLVR